MGDRFSQTPRARSRRLAAAALAAIVSVLAAPGMACAWNGTRQDTRLANETGDGAYTSPGASPASGIRDSRTRVNIYYPSGCAWDAAARVLVCRDADGAVTHRAADDEGNLGAVQTGYGTSVLTTGNPFAQESWYASLPVGFLVAWPSETDMPGSAGDDGPAAWLECDGRAIEAEEYPELSALLGEHVPDLTGAFLKGATDAEVAAGALAVISAGTLAAHGHAIPVGMARVAAGSGTDGELALEARLASDSLAEDATVTTREAADVTVMAPGGEDGFLSTGAAGGEETRPANRAVRVYIRALP